MSPTAPMHRRGYCNSKRLEAGRCALRKDEFGARIRRCRVVGILRPIMNNPAEDHLRISMSHALPRCLRAVAELNVADALGDLPRTGTRASRSSEQKDLIDCNAMNRGDAQMCAWRIDSHRAIAYI